MPEISAVELQKLQDRLHLAEQIRCRLKKKAKHRKTEEDNSVWTMLDLTTLLLIFFIVFYSQTLIKTKRQFEKQIPQPESEVASIESTRPGSLVEKTKISTPRAKTAWNDPKKIWDRDALSNQLEENLLHNLPPGKTKPYQVIREAHKVVVVLGEQITFRPGEAQILESFKPALKEIAALISTKSTFKVEIAGHTDDTPIHTAQFPSNWELAADRSIQVAKFLIAHGVTPYRLSTRAYAEYAPRYENTSDANRRANRRVEIALLDGHND